LKIHQKQIGKSDEWLTPKEILNELGIFDLDPCSPIVRPWDTAKLHLTIEDNGLLRNWGNKRVWLNPPFNKKLRDKWMAKMAKHNNGIMLVPAACETKAFRNYVWGKCSGILMLSNRPYFHYQNGEKSKYNSGCTICLIAYGDRNFEALLGSNLGICLKEIRKERE